MVQAKHKIESLVLEAWREQWSELEWSNRLKVVIAEQNGLDGKKLCVMILKQATLSEVPNNLMFSYLHFMVAAQMITWESFLEAVVSYRNIRRPQCVEAILKLLELAQARIRPSSLETSVLSQALLDLVKWLLAAAAIAGCSERSGQTLRRLVTDPFVRYCLYFESLERPAEFAAIKATVAELVNSASSGSETRLCLELQTFKEALEMLCPTLSPPPRRHINSDDAVLLSVVSYVGSTRLADNDAAIIRLLDAVRKTKEYSWQHICYALIRGSFLLQFEHGPTIQESSLSAFAYLKVPRLLSAMVKSTEMNLADIQATLEQLLRSGGPLLNRLDCRTASDNLAFLIGELKKVDLVDDALAASLLAVRKEERRVNDLTTEPSQSGSQGPISLVLKAEPTFQTLLKSFYSDFAKNQEKLVQMMHHMITGKSFEYICAAAAATGNLIHFVLKLVEFNECREPGGASLFDLSSLLLARILLMYGDKFLSGQPGEQCCLGSAVFRIWQKPPPGLPCRAWILGQSPSHISLGSANSHNSPAFTALEPGARELLDQLLAGDSSWKSMDWQRLLTMMPAMTGVILRRMGRDSADSGAIGKSPPDSYLSPEAIEAVLKNISLEVCSLLLSVAHSLFCLDDAHLSIQSRITKLAELILSHVNHQLINLSTGGGVINPSGTPSDNKQYTDRYTFLGAMIKRLLEPIINRAPMPLPMLPGAPIHLPDPSSLPPNLSKDILKQVWHDGLRYGWLRPVAVGLLERQMELSDGVDLWVKTWIEEFGRGEDIASHELLIAGVIIDPVRAARPLFTRIIDVIASSPSMCLPPRGVAMAQLLVQLIVLFHHRPLGGSSCGGKGGRNGKIVDKEGYSEESKRPRLSNQTALDAGDELEQLHEYVLDRISGLCESSDGVSPVIHWVGWFLRAWAQHAKLINARVPHSLIRLLISSDPQGLSVPHILSLYSLDVDYQRRQALQNIFLLRNLGAL